MPGFDPVPGLPVSPDFSTASEPQTPSQPANLDQLSSQFSSLLNTPSQPPRSGQGNVHSRVESRPQRDEDDNRTGDRRDTDKADDSHGTDRAQDRPRQEVHSREGRRDQGGDDQQQQQQPPSDGDSLLPTDAPDTTTTGGTDPTGIPNFSFGDAILRSLGGTVDQTAKTGGAAAVGASESLGKLAEQVASRILVSDPAHTNGQMEVRIQLKDSVLPGTEVQITQVGDQIQIKLVTESSRSHELLSTHAEILKNQLSERLDGRMVQVEVSMQSNPDSDGRSRQQRNLAEEWQESQDREGR